MESTLPSIALQLYTVRNELEAADRFEATLEQIAQIGYENVELAGFHGRSPEEFHRSLTRYGLKATSSHESLDGMETDIGGVIDRARLFGYTYIAVPWLAAEHRTPEGYRRIAERLKPVAERLKAEGLTLLWHNHDFEFIEHNGQIGYDIIMRDTAPDLVKLQIDLYWAVRSSKRTPHELFKLQPGRFVMWHIKDIDKKNHDYTELGNGSIDYTQIVPDTSLAGMEYYFVEPFHSSWSF